MSAIKKPPLERLARMQPAKARANLRPLVGVPHGFRIRVGEWRVSFTLDRKAAVMEVFEIEPRGGAYR